MTWADNTVTLLTVFWHQMLAYCCICQWMPADYENLYTFLQNPKHLAVWEEKLGAVKI